MEMLPVWWARWFVCWRNTQWLHFHEVDWRIYHVSYHHETLRLESSLNYNDHESASDNGAAEVPGIQLCNENTTETINLEWDMNFIITALLNMSLLWLLMSYHDTEWRLTSTTMAAVTTAELYLQWYELVGHAVTCLVETLYYETKGLGFDSRWVRWVTQYFIWPNPSSRIIALTQPLTEMSTMNLSGGKGQPALKPVNLTVFCEPFVFLEHLVA
jgi:hypothetical protein